MQQTKQKIRPGLIMNLAALLVGSMIMIVAIYMTQSVVLAQTGAPSITEIRKYLVIGMGDMADIDNAFQMSNTEIGADKNVLSPGEAVGFGSGSSFPNLLGVFGTRWNLTTNPDSLNNADPVFQGVDWSGNVALTSDNTSFDSANSLVYADLGIRTASARSQFDSVDGQSRYFAPGNSTSPVALLSAGTSNNNNLAPILTELAAWKSFIGALNGEATITKAQIESIFVNNRASGGNGGLRQTYADTLDTNNDGIILVDVNTEGIDFAVNNTDWVINGTGNKLIIFRINNGANMLMSNASILLGTGGIANRGVVFYHASEPGQSSDAVFSGSNVVLDGGAFWDLNDIGESGSGSDGHNIVINNGQGCWQFISQKVNFQNARWNRCAPTPPVLRATLGDRVWNDTNRNGLQDGGEVGVPNVTVTLLSGCTGNTVVGSTTTNAGGNYSFANLTPGQYRIQVTLPGGFQFSPQNQGANEAADSDVNPTNGISDCITLSAGQADNRWDAGINQPPVSTATPTNTPLPPTSTPTNTPIPQLASLGDRVWNDLNRNGIQDAGEPGIAGVTVQLKACNNNVLQSQQTDANGLYRFNNLNAGCYRVGVILPSGFQFSPQDQGGNDNTDSDVNPATAMTGDVNLGAGQNIDTVDAGINQPTAPTPTNTPVGPTATPTNTPAGGGTAVLGDRVWNDTNGNGVQDGGERGVPGVIVELLAGCTGNTVLATRPTNANGDYFFSNLTAGQYRVRFTRPTSFSSFSPKDAIADDDYDSDANPDGVTDCITLGNGEENYRVDAGLVSGGGPTATPTNTPVGPTATPTPTPAGPTPTPTPQVGGPLCYVGPCPDTDGDGVPDYLDEDDDNDGIPSVDEDVNHNGNPADDDSDGDGIPNYLDPLDSDNDTIPDIIEDVNRNGNLSDDNTDGDGLPNYLDSDSDNDGIPDQSEVGRVPSFPYDADRDGTPDYLDSDSDNDGQSDAAEGTGSHDGDGIPDYVDPQDEGPGSGDSDNDGVSDAIECPPALLGAAMPDLDRDGIPDYLDLDPITRFYLPAIFN